VAVGVKGAMAAEAKAATAADASTRLRPAAGPLTFTRLKWTSFTHSCVYTALLICAFAAGKPQPLTFVLGLSHGLLWIFMSLACIAQAGRGRGGAGGDRAVLRQRPVHPRAAPARGSQLDALAA